MKIATARQQPEKLRPVRIDFAADFVAPDHPEEEEGDDDRLDDQRFQDEEGDVQEVDLAAGR